MKRVALFLLISILVFSFGQAALAQYGAILVVNTSFLNVRTSDGPQYPVVVTVAGGTELPVLGTNSSNSWYLVSTEAGPGWVDVSFTLPRGDFRSVPVVKPTSGAPLSNGGPYSIALPGGSSGAPVYRAPASGNAQGSWRAVINVFSVNFRSQPADNGPIITTLYRSGLGTNDYAVLNFVFDSKGVRWISITVPNVGSGWIEADKTTLRQVGGASAAPVASAPASNVPVVPQSAAHLVVNTAFQNVRFGPGPSYVVVATVPGGTSLEVLGVNGDTTWYLVRGVFGQGWISSQFVLFRGSFSSVPVIHGAF